MTDLTPEYIKSLTHDALGIGTPNTEHPILRAFPTLTHPYNYNYGDERSAVESLFRQGFEALKAERQQTGKYNNPLPDGEQIVVNVYRVYNSPADIIIIADDAIYHEQLGENGKRHFSIRYDITPERLAATTTLRSWESERKARAAAVTNEEEWEVL